MTRRARRMGASAVLSLVVFTAATAQAMTLDEALRNGAGQEPGARGEDRRRRRGRRAHAPGRGLDDFSVNAGATWTHSRGSNVAAQSTPLLPYDSVDVSASLTRPLSTGGTVALKLDAPYARVGSSLVAGAPGDTGPLDAYQPSAQLSLTQPLLRGRGYDVARAPQRQARAQRDVVGWALEDAASGARARCVVRVLGARVPERRSRASSASAGGGAHAASRGQRADRRGQAAGVGVG